MEPLFSKNAVLWALKSQNFKKVYKINGKNKTILIGSTLSMHHYIRFCRMYVILKNASYIICTARYRVRYHPSFYTYTPIKAHACICMDWFDVSKFLHMFKGKGKVRPGCLLAEPVTIMAIFSMPLEPSFGTMPLSSALSQLITHLCGSALADTTCLLYTSPSPRD